MNIVTLHEAQQNADLRKPLAWPTYSTFAHCSGPCNQGRTVCLTPEACQTGQHDTAEADDDWEPLSLLDNIMFWAPVVAVTASLVGFILYAVGVRP